MIGAAMPGRFAIAGLGVIRLDEFPFFHSDIVGCKSSDVHVGMRVRAVFESVDAETVVPRFTPDATQPQRGCVTPLAR